MPMFDDPATMNERRMAAYTDKVSAQLPALRARMEKVLLALDPGDSNTYIQVDDMASGAVRQVVDELKESGYIATATTIAGNRLIAVRFPKENS